MFDKSDPYAEVRWNGELIGRSRVMEDATSPEWNESFVIRVEEHMEPFRNSLRRVFVAARF